MIAVNETPMTSSKFMILLTLDSVPILVVRTGQGMGTPNVSEFHFGIFPAILLLIILSHNALVFVFHVSFRIEANLYNTQATVISNGTQLLVSGGSSMDPDCSIYTEATDTWSAGPDMWQSRRDYGATRIDDHRWWITGGEIADSSFWDDE